MDGGRDGKMNIWLEGGMDGNMDRRMNRWMVRQIFFPTHCPC